MLRIALPLSGSLSKKVKELFSLAGLKIDQNHERDYRVSINDARISKVQVLRPQEIPRYVQDGLYDFGFTGKDQVIENDADVAILAEMNISRNGSRKVRIVLATNFDNPVNSTENIPMCSRIATEYPNMVRKYFDRLGRNDIRIIHSQGATEAKIPDIAEYVVEVVDSGETLMINDLKIIGTIMESATVMIGNKKSWNNPSKRKIMEEIRRQLLSAIPK